MKIRKFKAINSQEGMRLVRAAMGDDVNILACYSVADGVELVVTSDDVSALIPKARPQAVAATEVEEPALSAEEMQAMTNGRGRNLSALGYSAGTEILLRNSRAAQAQVAAEAVIAKPVQAPAPVAAPEAVAKPVAVSAPAPVAEAAPSPAAVDDMLALKQELSSMRVWLEQRMQQQSAALSAPDNALLAQWLDALGFERTWQAQHAGINQAVINGADVPDSLKAHFLQRVRTQSLHEQAPIVVVGPAGAGKTSAVAKLTMEYSSRLGADAVTLITTDSNRVGAQEQLFAVGRMTGVKVHAAITPDAIAQVMANLPAGQLVIVDTPTLNYQAEASTVLLAQLLAQLPNAQVQLALAMDMSVRAIKAVLKKVAHLPISGVLLTRLDVAESLLPILDTISNAAYPLTRINNSLRINEPLKMAKVDHLVNLAIEQVQAEYGLPVCEEALQVGVAQVRSA